MVPDKNSEKKISGVSLSSQPVLVSHLFLHPLSQPAWASQAPGPSVFHLQPTWITFSCPKLVFSLAFFFFLPKNKNMCYIHLVPWIAGKANFLRSYYVPWADPIPLSFYTASGGAGALPNSEINRLRSGKLKALEGEFANLLLVNAQQLPTRSDVCHMPGPP